MTGLIIFFIIWPLIALFVIFLTLSVGKWLNKWLSRFTKVNVVTNYSNIPVQVITDELFHFLEANPITGVLKYKKGVVQTTGIITDIYTNILTLSIPLIIIIDNHIVCYFTDNAAATRVQLAKDSKRKKVQIKGRFLGWNPSTKSVLIENCVLDSSV